MKAGIHSQSRRASKEKKKKRVVCPCRTTQMEEVDAAGCVLN